jgi:hypothetical protein
MCEKQMKRHTACDHLQYEDWIRCTAAEAQPGRTLCMSPSGYTQDLPPRS